MNLDLSQKTPELTALVCKALSSEVRLKILDLLSEVPMNISDLSNLLNIPMSSMTTHIRLLEEAKLISITALPGSRGMQKKCALIADGIFLNLRRHEGHGSDGLVLVLEQDIPIGNYFDYEVTAPCGLISHESGHPPFDDPGQFSSPWRFHAQLIWLTTGYLEYRLPLNAAYPFQTDIERIEISFELCSETFSYDEFWRSDVTVWINGQEIGYIECPGDHGGRHGLLNPDWWADSQTQYGDLANIILTQKGCIINSCSTDRFTIDSLDIGAGSYISFKLGVKEDARFAGGMNLFGEQFGDHPQAIRIKIYGKPYSPGTSRI